MSRKKTPQHIVVSGYSGKSVIGVTTIQAVAQMPFRFSQEFFDKF